MSNLPKGWKETELGQIVEIVNGGTPSTSNEDYWNGDISWITPKDLSNFEGRYISKGEKSITKEGLKNSSAKILPRNTILFSSRAPIGYVAIAKEEVSTNQGFKNIICDEVETHYLYMYYWLHNNAKQIEKLSSGSTFSEASTSLMKSLNIKIPKIDEQKEIANILSSFDKKIELLKKQNQTLETMAQTIFKEWFVNFNYPNATGEMIDSEMGEIPKGWKISDLKNLSEVISKGTTPIKSEKEKLLENIYFLKVKDITDNGNIKYDSLEKISSEIHTTVLKRSQLKTDDLLYSIAGTIGRVAILPKQLDNSNCNQALAFIRLKEKNKYLEYVHQWIQTSQIKNKINSSIVQGVQANVSLTVLGNLLIIIPDDKTVENWMNVIKPIYKKIKNNSEQIQTLEETRDSLLPKLMSGQKRVFEYDN